jgi:hypothetical protein
MAINILLLFLVFGATRWKKHPYAGAITLGLIKGALYVFVALDQVPLWAAALNGLIGLVVFGGLAAGMVNLIGRLDRYEPKEVRYLTPGAERPVFKWEYLPLTAILLLLILGESLVSLLLTSHR